MKKIFYIISALFISLPNVAQETNDPCFSANDFSNLIVESNPPISVNLPEGWSMFGYTCIEPIDVINAFQEISNEINIVKNYLGSAYLPEWGFNGIGDLVPGIGYQIKLNVAQNNLTFCDGLLIPEIYGCTDCESENFNIWATINDGSCIYYGCTASDYLEYNSSANIDDGTCLTLIIMGCTNPSYIEYNPLANVNDDSCITLPILGCTDEGYLEYNHEANTNVPFYCITAILYGCTNPSYVEYNPMANSDDGTCTTLPVLGCTDENYLEYNPEANINVPSFCVTELIISGCMDLNACNYNLNADVEDNSCEFPQEGYNCDGSTNLCLNEIVTNYNPGINFVLDEECTYNQNLYDNNGNLLAVVGDIYEGGLLFYVDPSGTRGIVCANNYYNNISNSNAYQYIDSENLEIWGEEKNGFLIGSGIQNTMEFNNQDPNSPATSASTQASSVNLNGFDDWYVPSGLEYRAMDKNIVQNSEIYSTIENDEMYQFMFTGNGIFNLYISSTQPYDIDTYGIQSQGYYFDTTGYYSGFTSGQTNVGYFKVIRYVGDWIMGCNNEDACNYSDSITLPTTCDYPLEGYNCEGECISGVCIGCNDNTSCNFNPLASVDNGSCEFPQNGYDCEGNILNIGSIYQGGYIFELYYDDNGTPHGKIADMEDLGEYKLWQLRQSATYEQANNLCAESTNSGYDDWYLPSIDELNSMYDQIGNGSSISDLLNIGLFVENTYWSSSETGNYEAVQGVTYGQSYYIDFGNGSEHYITHSYEIGVRAIREF